MIEKERIFSLWFAFLRDIRSILEKRGLKPVETPSLVKCPGTEPELDPFEIKGSGSKKFLITSPEMHLKRLLCQGFTNIYEIKKCFRNNELGRFSSSEFYLLEWYRAYKPLSFLIEDLQEILQGLAKKIKCAVPPPIQKVSMKELFKKHLNIHLKTTDSKKDFIKYVQAKNIPFSQTHSTSDLFHLLFLNGIEPHLDPSTPLIIDNYPPFQKAFAKINKAGWASRFEFFWKGFELANAFDEVTDPIEQKRRFAEHLKTRKKQNKTTVPEDKELLKDMKNSGMPPSAGIALGLERLFIAFYNLKNILMLPFF